MPEVNSQPPLRPTMSQSASRRMIDAAIEQAAAAIREFATRPGLALIAGGIPIVVDGRVAGAIGVAGAMTAAEDRRIAERAAAEFAGPVHFTEGLA